MRTVSFRALISATSNSRKSSYCALLLAAASIPALLAGTSGASAADLSYKDERPAIMGYSGGSWAGGYFGAHAGWSGADNKSANPFIDRFDGGPGGDGGVVSIFGIPIGLGGDGGDGGAAGGVGAFDDDDNNVIAGLHLGYNWQRDSLVYGVEADIDTNGSLHDLLGSIRGRLGYATPSTLFYATAGLAYLSVDGDARSVLVGGAAGDGGNGGVPGGGAGGGGAAVGNVEFSRDDDSEFGFVGGIGVEHKLTSSVSIGLEGLYYTFDELNSGLDSDFFTVRARLSFHLNGDRELSAKDSFSDVSIANWRGFYVGLHAGVLGEASSDNIDAVDAANGGNGQDGQNGLGVAGGGGGGGGGGGAAIALLDDDLGILGGGHIGYNFQRGQWVYGVEGDASVSDKDKYDYLASARARIGYTHGSYLFYATGGIAFAGYNGFNGIFANDGENGDNGTSPILLPRPPFLIPGQGGDGGDGGTAGAQKNSDDLVGFVVGGGVEAKVTDRLTLGFEGLYYGFDADNKGVAGDSTFLGSDDADVFVLRSRISYSLTPEVEALK